MYTIYNIIYTLYFSTNKHIILLLCLLSGTRAWEYQHGSGRPIQTARTWRKRVAIEIGTRYDQLVINIPDHYIISIMVFCYSLNIQSRTMYICPYVC